MKEHPRLTLGEDFAQEKSWQWEDITVLTARLTLPQTKGESRREKRFDRYFYLLRKCCSGLIFSLTFYEYISRHNNCFCFFSGIRQIPLYKQYIQTFFHVTFLPLFSDHLQ